VVRQPPEQPGIGAGAVMGPSWAQPAYGG